MKNYITLIFLSCFIHSLLYAQISLDSEKMETEEDEEEYYDDILGRAAEEAILQGQLPGKEFNYARARWDAYLDFQNRQGARNDKVANINGNWAFIGPYAVTSGHIGIGRVQAIEVISETEWIVGTAQGGLWKTTDAGITWSCLTDGLPNLSITDVDVDPNNSDIIYILTGDRDGSVSAQTGPPGIGILKSVNGGQTWLSTGMFFERNEKFFGDRIEVDPNNSNRIWATIKDSIFVSENGGLEFTQSGPGKGFRDLELMPGNPDFVLASGTSTVWYRESQGSDWIKSSGLEDVEDPSRLLISYAPSNPDKVYAIFAKSDEYYRIYRSYNGGVSFTEFDTDTIDIFGDQAYYDMTLTVDPNDENILYAGGSSMYKSINSGASWQLASCQKNCTDLPYVHPDYHALEMTPDGVLLIGNDGGIFHSFGDTILDVSSGLHITQLYHVTTLGSDLNVIAAGAQDNGILLRESGGSDFGNLIQLDGFETCFVTQDVFYSTCQKGMFFLHDSSGEMNSISPDSEGAWDTPFIQDPNDPNTVYICYDSIYRLHYLSNFGTAFSNLIAPSPNNSTIIEAAIGISNTSRFYTFERFKVDVADSSQDWGVLYRTDNFKKFQPTFDSVYSSQTIYLLTDIVVDPANSLRIWITIGGYDAGSKVYFSDDGGESFANVSGSLPNVPAYCITYVPGSDDGLYVGTDIGVFYTDNNLGEWIPFQNGLPVASVREIEVFPTYGIMRVATMGRGIWASEMFSGECEDTIHIDDGEFDEGANLVQVTDLITSVAILDQGIGTDVTYDSGDAIYLYEGFEVKAQGVFTAKIDGCQSLVSKYAALSGTYEGPMTESESILATTTQIPIDISLYPNPAHKQTTIEFSLDVESKVSIYVLDQIGKVVFCLADGEEYLEGNHQIQFDTGSLAANIYSIHLLSSSGQGFAKLDVVH